MIKQSGSPTSFQKIRKMRRWETLILHPDFPGHFGSQILEFSNKKQIMQVKSPNCMVEIERKGTYARYLILQTLKTGWAYIHVAEAMSTEIKT